MKNTNINLNLALLTLLIGFSFISPNILHAATTPSLGDASSYGVLSGTYVNTNVPLPTTINGDVGFTTAPAVSPLGAHTNYGFAAPYATAGTAQAAALANLNGQGCDFTFVAPAVDLSATVEHSSTYSPGVYCNTGALSVGTTITLNGAGTYIFRSGGALNTVTGSIVTLSPGASACDVFWTPNGATTLNANSTFIGTVIPVAQDITVLDATSWIGRALTFGHVVTTPDANVIITAPNCSIPVIPVTPTPPITVASVSGGGASMGGGGGGGFMPVYTGIGPTGYGAISTQGQVLGAMTPSFPNTGLAPDGGTMWHTLVLAGAFLLLSIPVVVVLLGVL